MKGENNISVVMNDCIIFLYYINIVIIIIVVVVVIVIIIIIMYSPILSFPSEDKSTFNNDHIDVGLASKGGGS